jgi:hypothetical protein
MNQATDHKIVLLLTPQRMLTDHVVLQSLHIHKNGRSVDYIVNELNQAELRRYYTQYPPELKSVLASFRQEAMDERIAAIKKRHAVQRAGIAYDSYFGNSMIREIHSVFEKLKPHAESLKWYHKIRANEKFKTGPCNLFAIKPRLHFEIQETNRRLQLQIMVTINDESFSLDQFNRFNFFLEKDCQYYLLSFKDHQTLDWLSQNNPSAYSNTPELLSKNILSKLEEDYTVNRNGLFSQNVIETTPVNRVMLSEISGSFLVLTPQWMYESFLVEGEWKETYETTKQGEAYVVKRNMEEEAAFRSFIIQLHPNFTRQLNGYYYLSFAEAQKKQWFFKSLPPVARKEYPGNWYGYASAFQVFFI